MFLIADPLLIYGVVDDAPDWLVATVIILAIGDLDWEDRSSNRSNR